MCLEPRCRVESQSLGQLPPLSTTPAMKGDFVEHFRTSPSLSIPRIVFLMTHLETKLLSVSRSLVKLVPKVDSSSQHSLTRHSDSTSSESDFITAAPKEGFQLDSVKIQFSLPKRRIGITYVSMIDLVESGLRSP